MPSSCRDCGKVFEPIPESYPLIIQQAFAEVDICSDCCARKIMECPYCGAERTYYDGWNCPTEGCDSQHNAGGMARELAAQDSESKSNNPAVSG